MWHMGAGEQVTAGREELIGREADAAVDSLRRAHPRALEDNPDGLEMIGEAVRRAIGLGLHAGCKQARRTVGELDYGRADAWESWQRQRERTPESTAWPAELEATAPEVVEEARELLVAAGVELGLRGRSARALRHAGGQAAEAGAALARVLAEPSPAAEAPRSATAAPVGAIQPDGTVRVAVAANQAEAELLQGVLDDAGIPSTWRRTGGDLPELLAAGYREIYVPADAADEAQALLATMETPSSSEEADVAPTRRIGLERTGLRLIGKATAVLVVAGILISLGVGFATDEPGLGVAVLVLTLIAGVAIVVWSERAGHA
jgi:Putative prokaryotic signal transducing protein